MQTQPWELHVTETDWCRVEGHFFPGDPREHAGVLVCGVSREPLRNRLLVRQFIPTGEPVDYGRGVSCDALPHRSRRD